jgi:uncharacterized membrane protein YfcA
MSSHWLKTAHLPASEYHNGSLSSPFPHYGLYKIAGRGAYDGMTTLSLILYFFVSIAAGIINTIAGGGSFLTFPSLLLTGLDARAANVTSTIALFPMQLSTGYAGRSDAGGTEHVRFRHLFLISLAGGAIGAILLLLTPSAFFGKMVPWFVLFATTVFAWSAFFKKPYKEGMPQHHFQKAGTIISQFFIGIYGGYFGAGVGILMLAALMRSTISIRKAGATKNILAAAINTSAVLIFLFSKDIGWIQIGIGMPASVAGGYIGTKMLNKVNDRKLRIFVVVWGAFLAFAMFIRSKYYP